MRNSRMYWSNHVGSSIIKQGLSLKEFEFIRRYLHFSNNDDTVDDKKSPNFDRLFKIRPILEHVQKVSASILYKRDLYVDENICATKQRSYMKQYNPKKPHK